MHIVVANDIHADGASSEHTSSAPFGSAFGDASDSFVAPAAKPFRRVDCRGGFSCSTIDLPTTMGIIFENKTAWTQVSTKDIDGNESDEDRSPWLESEAASQSHTWQQIRSRVPFDCKERSISIDDVAINRCVTSERMIRSDIARCTAITQAIDNSTGSAPLPQFLMRCKNQETCSDKSLAKTRYESAGVRYYRSSHCRSWLAGCGGILKDSLAPSQLFVFSLVSQSVNHPFSGSKLMTLRHIRHRWVGRTA